MIGSKSLNKRKENIRVSLLIDAWEPVWGGGQTHVWNLAQELVSTYPCNIDIYTRSLFDDKGKAYTATESTLNNKIRIIRVGPLDHFFSPIGRIIWPLYVVWKIYLAHRMHAYDLIHGHAYLGAIPTKLLSLVLGLPSIFTVHGSNTLDLRPSSLKGFIERVLLTQIKFTYEISVSRHFLKYQNVNNVMEIANGVRVPRHLSRKYLSKKFTVLWVGRFDPIKAVDVLIEAFVSFHNKYSNTELVLAGYGYAENSLRDLVNNLKARDFIHFTGKQTKEKLGKLYQKSSIFILPSYSEGQSLTFLEALANKLPVIVSNVGDMGRLVKQSKSGFVLSEVSKSALVKTLIIAIRNQPTLRKMGNRGFQWVQKKHTWKQSAKATFSLYKQVLEK